MGESKHEQSRQSATSDLQFAAKADSFDPTLASLFASSSGPIKIRARVAQSLKPTATRNTSEKDDPEDSDVSSEAENNIPSPNPAAADAVERPRKRRRVADGDDLEGAYFKRLEREEEKDMRRKRLAENTADVGSDDDATSSSGIEDESVDPATIADIPRHETLAQKDTDKDKLKRTVFLGNVSTEVIKSKVAKKTLTKHLQSVLKTKTEDESPGKFESIRFRSTPYTSDSGPKKATFAKKELMDETATSTNAYAVFTTELAARRVAEKLNGSSVLDRHLRVDYLGNPAKVDNKRCVFIGNLSFVNEETAGEGADGAAQKHRPTAKEPADAEEGLWRTFGKVGKVESVRVVRDQETRISKGFAYVQFVDENSVEAALLMNDKKFPPMLPRKLRVMRARKTKHQGPPRGAPFDKSRSRKSGGTSKHPRNVRQNGQAKAGFIFEGHRASSTSKSKSGSSTSKRSKRPTTRSSRRGAAFKAAGGKRNQREGQ